MVDLITPLPDPPSRTSNTNDEFVAAMDAWLVGQQTLVTEANTSIGQMNALGDGIEATAADVASSVAEAAGYATALALGTGGYYYTTLAAGLAETATGESFVIVTAGGLVQIGYNDGASGVVRAEFVTLASAAGPGALDDIADVDAAAPTDGDALIFNSGSGNWEAGPLDFAAASHSHSNATGGAAGFMSAADKTRLDGLAAPLVAKLASDFTTTSTTFVDTGLEFTPSASTMYKISLVAPVKLSDPSKNLRFGISWPTGLTIGTATVLLEDSSTVDTGSLIAARVMHLTTATSPFHSDVMDGHTAYKNTIIEFVIVAGPSVAGALKLTAAVGSSAKTMTVGAGACMIITQL